MRTQGFTIMNYALMDQFNTLSKNNYLNIPTEIEVHEDE